MKRGDILTGVLNIEVKTVKKNIIVCYLLNDGFERIYRNITHRGEVFKTIILNKKKIKKYKNIHREFIPF